MGRYRCNFIVLKFFLYLFIIQKEVNILEEDSPEVGNLDHYICSDCLIELLPKALLTDEDMKKQPTPVGDRRYTERFPVYSHVYLMHQSHPRFFGAVILDISDAGMKLVMNDEFKTGEVITLSFIGQKLLYKATGKVIRSQVIDNQPAFGYEIGIRFTAIHQEFRDA